MKHGYCKATNGTWNRACETPNKDGSRTVVEEWWNGKRSGCFRAFSRAFFSSTIFQIILQPFSQNI